MVHGVLRCLHHCWEKAFGIGFYSGLLASGHSSCVLEEVSRRDGEEQYHLLWLRSLVTRWLGSLIVIMRETSMSEYLWEILEGGGCLTVAGKPFGPIDLNLGSLDAVLSVPPRR